MTSTSITTGRRRAIGVIGAAAAATMLAGCGSGSSAGSTGSPSNGQVGTPSIAYPMELVSGKIKSVGNDGVAVTTSSGSSDIAFGTSTQFSEIADSSRSDVKVDDCLAVTSKSGGFGAASLTATTITISGTSACMQRTIQRGPGGALPQGGQPGTAAPDNGAPGAQSGGEGGAPPAGGPPSTPTGRGGSFSPLGGAMGTVTSLTRSAIVIKTPAGSSTTVKTTNSTSYTTRSAATASDATSGQCVSAAGRKSGTTLDALSVTITAPHGGVCKPVAARPFGLGGFQSAGGPGAPSGGTSNG